MPAEPSELRDTWQRDGYAVLPGFLTGDEIAPAVAGLPTMFPTADGFHDRTDPRWDRFVDDEFDGIDSLPFGSVEVSLLALHDRLAGLAGDLLGLRDPGDLRLYTAESWAKYTGANDYDQSLHRDYLNHTALVPSLDPAYSQVEMFVYLCDVPEELGPPHLVSRTLTADLPARPNWLPRAEPTDDEDGWLSRTPRPDLYAAERSGAGPAGTVVAFHPATFHRGTGLRQPRGARYTMHLGFRPAAVEWGHRHAWADRSHDDGFGDLVSRATPRQLALLGFPSPGHPFWTPETLTAMAERYPGLDLDPWRRRP